MPVLARFHGMTVKMYFLGREHNPPHVHFLCGDHMGVIEIRTQSMLEGDLPPRALAQAQTWTRLHQDELLEMWNTQNFRKLPPPD